MLEQAQPPRAARSGSRASRSVPPQAFFLVSAIFHYLGPSLAVLLFTRVDALGVAWLRIASAALVFAAWRRPWRLASASFAVAWPWRAKRPSRPGDSSSGETLRLRLDRGQVRLLLALGVVLAAMNSVFYLAVARLPLSTVGAIEFLGTVVLAAVGTRTRRNVAALGLTTAGVAAITAIRISGHPLGFVFAFGNCVLFMAYVVLGHRIANRPGGGGVTGIDLLAAAMLIGAAAATPSGLGPALPAFTHVIWLLAGAGVGICSSVIPYVTDQLVMARLPRATFALMLALLPVFATIIGAIVLRQFPTWQDIGGIALVTAGVAVHKERK